MEKHQGRMNENCTMEKKIMHNKLITKLSPVDPQKNSRLNHTRNKRNVFLQPVLGMKRGTTG